MSVPRQSVSTTEDLEATAELPVLDLAAFESKAAQERHDETEARIASASSVAQPAKDSVNLQPAARLEEDLRSLSNALRDVEERLSLKGERLTQIERELETERAARAAADQRSATLTRELAQTQTAFSIAQSRIGELTQSIELRDNTSSTQQGRVAALEAQIAESARALKQAQQQQRDTELRTAGYLELLQSQESRRGAFDIQLRGLDSDVREREARIRELERQLSSGGEHTAELEAELASRARRIGGLESEVNKLGAALSGSTSESDVKERANEELRRTVAALTASSAAQAERIRQLEAEANARTQEHAAALRAAAAVQQELEAANVSQRHRIDAFEAQLASMRSELDNRTEALQALETEQRERQARLTASESRTRELEDQIADQQETHRRFQEELLAFRERMEIGENDLRAAEDTINRLEADLRAKSTKLDELMRTQEEWRATVEDARQSLDTRDSMIRRLETEAANSAALLSNIQISIKRLDQPIAEPAAALASSNELAPEGATRLLIRSDGDTEVVHVLGRKTTIGRTPDNDVQIDTKFISRHHAVILAAPAHTIIEDLNSTNGVTVNGKRVRRHPLKDGDAVAVGKTQFRFAVRPAAPR